MTSLARAGLVAAALAATACTRAAPRHDADPEAAQKKRVELVDGIAKRGAATHANVLDAMRRVPRHLFVPGASLDEAYADEALDIGEEQTISQPSVVAEMTEALDLSGTERVLEIGTGSGYQAAVLSLLSAEVDSIEILPELGERAAARLRGLGYANVHVRIGDGYAGWPEKAPFDRIVLTAAPSELPEPLVDELADGGLLVAPVGEQGHDQWLVRVRKNGGRLTRERLETVHFVPMVRSQRR